MSEKVTPKITPKQRKAIESLMTNANVLDAAKAAGVSRQTIYRWMNTDLAFQQALCKAETEALTGLSRSLVTLGVKATQTLEQTLSDQGSSAGARVRAADIILGRLLQLRELVSLEERISRLEQQIESKNYRTQN